MPAIIELHPGVFKEVQRQPQLTWALSLEKANAKTEWRGMFVVGNMKNKQHTDGEVEVTSGDWLML